MENVDTSNERSVYKWTQAFDVKEQRIVAVDSHDNVVALGDKKGYVFPFEEQVSMGGDGQIGSSSNFDPLTDGGKRGPGEINAIKYLPRCSMIALLSNNVINIVQSYDLSSVQEIKSKKIHMFCVNNAVYSNEGDALMD